MFVSCTMVNENNINSLFNSSLKYIGTLTSLLRSLKYFPGNRLIKPAILLGNIQAIVKQIHMYVR